MGSQAITRSLEIVNLGLKTNYTVKIAGITSKGIGVYAGVFYAETGDYRKFDLDFFQLVRTTLWYGSCFSIGRVATTFVFDTLHFFMHNTFSAK